MCQADTVISSCHVLTHDPQRGGYYPQLKDEEVAKEKLSNLSEVTLLLMAGLDPDPGGADSKGCIATHCTAKESRQLQLRSETFDFFRAYSSLFVFQNALLCFFNRNFLMYIWKFFEVYDGDDRCFSNLYIPDRNYIKTEKVLI